MNQGTRTQFKLRQIASWYKHDELILKPKFQRNSVWNDQAKSSLIDTVLRDLPLPIILIRQIGGSKRLNELEVVDGRQRLTTLLAFLDPESFEKDSFLLSRSHSKVYGASKYEELEDELQSRLLEYEITVHTLPDSTSDGTVLEIFQRLNSTGYKLNDQELRNAQYSGAFKQYSYKVGAGNYAFWADWKLFNSDALARMEETQFASDLTLYMLEGLRASNKDVLNKLYRENDEDFLWQDQAEFCFNLTLQYINQYGDNLPARSSFRKRSWFYTLFCVIYESLFREKKLDNIDVETVQLESLPDNLGDRLIAFDQYLENIDVDGNIKKAVRTTNLNSRTLRHEFLKNYLFA